MALTHMMVVSTITLLGIHLLCMGHWKTSSPAPSSPEESDEATHSRSLSLFGKTQGWIQFFLNYYFDSELY